MTGRLLAALCVLGALAVLGAPAPAAAAPGPASTSAGHVVVVGISGLTWSDVTPDGTPELWRLAGDGSVGALVDYAQQPLACPADGWLTLNSAARAQGPRPCAPLPAVVRDDRGARVPAMPGIIRANQGYHESPAWGLLGRLAGCATAAGPGAALALAAPSGAVTAYLPSAGDLSAPVLARCPLTVVDLGQIPTGRTERMVASALDRQLAALAARLPSGTRLLVTAPGAATGAAGVASGAPHLMTAVVNGPGYGPGLLASSATRRPGVVTLTDLTPTVAGWLGTVVPAGTAGARITRADRGDLAGTVAALDQRDAAEQVWLASHGWFFLGYAAAAALAFAVPALPWPGGGERRRRRARCWRLAGLAATAVPLGSYLANLFPWAGLAHPACWLYGLTAGWTLVVAAGALTGPWRRDPLGPFGAVCTATLLLLAVDVMAGSRLQLEAPFGLSLLVSGRYYGINNNALGVYCVSTLVAAAWLASMSRPAQPFTAEPNPVRHRRPSPPLVAGAVGLLAVVASGWPGFGAKAGGTIALVPCLLLLMASLAGVRAGGRWAVPVAASGLVLLLVFAVTSYLLPAAGLSDLGPFAGNLLHGRGGDLLARKAGANVGSLTSNGPLWLIPVAAALAAAALWRPAALRLRTLADAFAARPPLRPLAWLCWLVLVLGWLADDSGVLVPAVALPFAVALTAGMAAAVTSGDAPAEPTG